MFTTREFGLFVSVWVFSVTTQTASAFSCNTQAISGMKLAVSSAMSENGNWITKLDMKHDVERSLAEKKLTEPWLVAVDTNSTTCGKVDTLHVSFTITAPRSENISLKESPQKTNVFEESPQKANVLEISPKKSNDFNDTSQKPILPKEISQNTILPDKPPHKPIRQDYELFTDIGYYKFHDNATTWNHAQEVCAEEGAHLVIINSEQEADVIKKLFARYPTIHGTTNNDWAWIGAKVKEKVATTVEGQTLTSTGFYKWNFTPEPIFGSPACLLVYRQTGLLGFLYNCTTNLAFACEHEL